MAKGGEDTAKINEKSDAIALLERLANAPAELPPTPPARASQRDGTEPRAPLFATFTAVSSSDLLAGCQGTLSPHGQHVYCWETRMLCALREAVRGVAHG